MAEREYRVTATVELLIGSRRGDDALLAQGMTPAALALSEAENYLDDVLGASALGWAAEDYEVMAGEDPVPVRVRLGCTCYGTSKGEMGRMASADLEGFLEGEIVSVEVV